MAKPIYVTQPSLAPLEEYLPYLEGIWKSGIMTHNGPLMRRLEKELQTYLDVPNVVCLSNGTCALQLAMHAFDLAGEVITTPFTYIASASVIAWERCRPVFVDIDPDTWCIDPGKIEEKITDATSAIMPVHVFSRPCDLDSIERIAQKHGLKVIYDAAHAMAVEVDGKSILRYGDVSAISFHATKLFNTAEGGACVTDNDELAERFRHYRFFGHDENKDIVNGGMNAKMTEVHAALGLANLKGLDPVRENRRTKYELYRDTLSDVSFVNFQDYPPESYNYSYMPVLFETEELLEKAERALTADAIYAKRYFAPSLNTLPVFAPQDELPVSERVAKTILCLPLYDSLTEEDIHRVCGHIASC